MRRSSCFECERLEPRRLLAIDGFGVSEVMFNPTVTDQQRVAGLKDRDFEFIEFSNQGTRPVVMNGMSIQDAVDFAFRDLTLEPGQFAVIVANRDAFEARYGRNVNVVGEYAGTLGNGSERIVLLDFAGQPVEEMTYDDTWYPNTDGGGRSLTAASSGRLLDKNLPTSWRASSRLGGSPGFGDGPDDPRPQRLLAEVQSVRHVALNWSAPQRPTQGEAYRVYRDSVWLGETTELAFLDREVMPGANYAYRVAALAADGSESDSVLVSVRVEAVGGDIEFRPGSATGVVQIGLNELSGLVASRAQEGVFWTHNDGAQTSVFAIADDGRFLAAYELQGIASRDWEDIAIGRGPDPGVDYLYVSNTGAKPNRNLVDVFRLPEPTVDLDGIATTHRVADVATISFQYPDGGLYNSETLLSDPQTGDLYIIPKQGNDTPIFRAAADDLVANAIVPLQDVGRVTLPNVSGGDISPQGDELVVRNEDLAVLFTRAAGQAVADAFARQPVLIPLVGRPVEPNGEAITFDHTGRNYYTVSEGDAPPLYVFERVTIGSPGDANRDGRFDTADLVAVFQAGRYQAERPALWSEGDWNGDGFFDSSDLVAAFAVGNFAS